MDYYLSQVQDLIIIFVFLIVLKKIIIQNIFYARKII